MEVGDTLPLGPSGSHPTLLEVTGVRVGAQARGALRLHDEVEVLQGAELDVLRGQGWGQGGCTH